MSTEHVTVRDATADDDLDGLNNGNAMWLNANVYRDAMAADPTVPSALLVAELDGAPAGSAFAVAAGIAENRRAPALVYVPSRYRRRGVGSALWAAVCAMCTPGRVSGIMLQTDADDATRCATAIGHGLSLGGVHRESELVLTEFTLEPIVPPGIRIEALAADAGDQLWHRVADLHNELLLDTPDAGAGVEPMPYEFLRSFLVEPWQVMLAWDGKEIVGYTSVLPRDAAARRLNTLLTGVTRDFRGRGLSTAVKAAHARRLRDAGWHTIVTQNMAGNTAILASNDRLGYCTTRSLRDLFVDFPDGSPHDVANAVVA